MKKTVIYIAIALCACKTQTAVAVKEPAPVSDSTTATSASIALSSPKTERSTPVPPKTLVWLDFETGYKKAVAENKIILVDMYTTWCYWCKVMDKETFTDSAVIAEINTHFVPVKMNPEVDATFRFGDTVMNNAELYLWLGYGKRFGFPTSYFWLQPGKSEERYSLAGYHEPAAFMQILNQIKAKKAAK